MVSMAAMERWATSAVGGIVGLCTAALPWPLAAAADHPAPAQCVLTPGAVRTVTRIVDSETLVLDDGGVVRLIGALAPRARDAGAAPESWPPENDAIKALSDLVLGKTVKLAFAGRRTDRYGRLLAHVFVRNGTAEEWVQGAMLAYGNARAYGLPGNFACAGELLAHEAQARQNRTGLWNNGVYRLLHADKPSTLLAMRGKYGLVVGTVMSLGQAKGATYLNFGADWKTDFTGRIARSVLLNHPELSGTLEALRGKRVIVRGWIERRNGPLIDIADPSQVELVHGEADVTEGVDAAPPASLPGVTLSPTVPAGTDPGLSSGGRKDLRPAPPEGAEPGALDL